MKMVLVGMENEKIGRWFGSIIFPLFLFSNQPWKSPFWVAFFILNIYNVHEGGYCVEGYITSNSRYYLEEASYLTHLIRVLNIYK